MCKGLKGGSKKEMALIKKQGREEGEEIKTERR